MAPKIIKWQERNVDVLATATTSIHNPTAKLGLEGINRNSYSWDIKKKLTHNHKIGSLSNKCNEILNK